MTARVRWPVALAIGAGLALAVWTISRLGIGSIVGAAAHVGALGFAGVCVASLGLNGLLGAAWLAAMPGESARRIGLFGWARTAREGANDLLPLSQLGGLVVGATTLIRAGLDPVRVYASMIVDLTTEMVAQIVFTLIALWTLGPGAAETDLGHHLVPLAWVGGGIAVAIAASFVVFQRPTLRLAAFLAGHLLPRAQTPFAEVRAALDRSYRAHGALALSFLFNLLGWAASASLSWLILLLIGQNPAFGRVLAMESLIFALRSAAFVVPGALGVQEAGYLLLAPALGLDPHAAVALSLVKRARDVAIGLPALIAWQGWHLRALIRRPRLPEEA